VTTLGLEAIEDLTKLALVVASLYIGFGAYVRHQQPAWMDPLARRRAGILLLLVLVASAIKLSEDVLGGESGPIDKAILVFIRSHVPTALAGVADAITFTGSSKALIPLATGATLVLLLVRRRVEALVIAASVIGGALLVFAIKTAVGRARPALWDTQWYWGSSFPSGHTLVVAAFATALALCIGRIWPRARLASLGVALAWTLLVALSRLVLGVHWPTDVLVATCVGASIPLTLSVALDLRRASRARHRAP